MRLFALSRCYETVPEPTYRNTWVYQNFFHGGQDVAALNLYRQGPYEERRLVRNVALTPEVFFVPGALVVGPSVARALRGLPHVDLVPVRVGRVYEHPIDEGSIQALLADNSPLGDDFYQWVDRAVVAYGRRPRPAYDLHEVVVPRLMMLAPAAGGGPEIVLPNPVADGEPHVGGPTDTSVHERHPVVKAYPYYVFTERAFEPLRPHVSDPECFTVIEIEI